MSETTPGVYAPVCPHCQGQRATIVFVDGVRNGRRCGWQEERTCRTCDGAGTVDEDTAVRIEGGSRLRASRIALGLSLKEQAELFGMDPLRLNDLEHGRVPGKPRRPAPGAEVPHA